MSTPISVVMVGSAGYAASHVNKLLDPKVADELRLVAVVDPFAASSPHYERFKTLVPVYDSLTEFYIKQSADLAFIATPIHLHFEQCMTAMDNGSHVLCEKPLVPTLALLDLLKAKSVSTGKTLAVAFQWCNSTVILGIKERILAGEFGKPLSMKSYTTWSRGWKYFARSWAGKRKSEDGKPINDSVLSNATAHYIHNILFLLGPSMIESATLEDIRAECYLVNDLESFDTIVMRGQISGAKIFYAASHATNYHLPHPVIDYSFENARILFSFAEQDGHCNIHHKDGRIEKLGSATGSGMWDNIVFPAQSVKGLRPWYCTIDTVRPFTELIDYVFSQVPVLPFNKEFVVTDTENQITYVKNLHLDLMEGFNRMKLPTETGLPWV